MRSHLKLTTLVVAAAVASCAVFSSKHEYCLFREITETQDVVRLAQLYDAYTTQYPDGVYVEQLELMRPEIEREMFVGAGQERGLLWRYIEIFPEGIFSQLARDKITQLDAMIRFETEKKAAYDAAKKAELEEHEKARQILVSAFNSAIVDWIAVAGLAPYGKDVAEIAALSPRFMEIWSSVPLAECDATSCVKRYVVDQWYQVPGGTRENRRLDLAVKLVFHEGGLLGISLTFPDRGVLPLLEELDKVPYDMEESALDGATFLVMDQLEQTATDSLAAGQEVDVEGAMWAWDCPQAKLSFVRKGDIDSGVTDTLTIQLLPPAPEEPEPDKKIKKKKKKPEPEPPPPPLATVEDLLWTPPPPAALAAPPPSGADAPPPEAGTTGPATEEPPKE
ncbi:MAG: hypothetical protein JRG91_02460 [Deltaproteobacteria bacterium]|nr:hypothetical protein [Deltaproteobacteria bacterium]